MEFDFVSLILLITVGAGCYLLGTYSESNIEYYDWVKEEDVHVYDDNVVIDVPDLAHGHVLGTGSMLPTVSGNCTLLYHVPPNENEINIGDIITFTKGEKLIIHRVIKKSRDEKGMYYITKGDNNWVRDGGKVYFKNVHYVVVGILY